MVSNVQQEEKWQREEDARTLARAQEIMADKKRVAAAIKEAKRMVKEDEKRVASMKKVARKPAKKVTKKKVSKKKK